MALNPQYDAIGKGFVQQYYTLFDDPAQRANLANMYNVSIFTSIRALRLILPKLRALFSLYYRQFYEFLGYFVSRRKNE